MADDVVDAGAEQGASEGNAEPTGMLAEHRAAQQAETLDPSLDQQDVGGVQYDSKPDWLDPQFYNEETGQVDLQGLQKSQRDFRNKTRQNDDAQGVPEDVNEYSFDHADSLQLDDNDPLVAASKEAALKYGLSKEAYAGFMGEMMSEIGNLNGTAEIDAQSEREKLGANHERVLQDLSDSIDGLVDIGLLGEQDYNAALDVAATADGVRLLNKIIGHYQSKPSIPMSTAVPEGMMSKDELDAAVGSERYNNEPAFRAKIKQGYEKLYGRA